MTEVSKSVNEEFKGQNKPSAAFVAGSWIALIAGIASFCIGLYNASMWISEKGFYFTVLMFGLFSAISLQKSVRDKMEGIAVTPIYYGLSWACTIMSIMLLTIGLWNADLLLSEKGFFGISFLLALFAVIAVQKNTRDNILAAVE